VDVIESAAWNNPGELKATFGSASFVGDLTVFNISREQISHCGLRPLPCADHLHQAYRHSRGVRQMGALTAGFDMKRYGRLLAKASPRVIASDRERDRAVAIVESLMEKGERNMTPEEDALLSLVTNLIRDYEAGVYPPRERSKPHRMVAFLLEQRGLSSKDLWPVIGSKGRVSEILSGKRGISKEQAKTLAEFFHVRADLFF
jgi:HTH-type transcriptional regulator / antitoxin HigA